MMHHALSAVVEIQSALSTYPEEGWKELLQRVTEDLETRTLLIKSIQEELGDTK